MKTKISINLIVVMICILIVGCSSNQGSENTNQDINDSSSETSKNEVKVVVASDDVEDELKELAKAEGLSVKELKEIEEGLIKIGAEKYGVTEEAYVATIESSGQTVLGEWKVAADYMGLSIKAMYDYEKESLSSMSEEQKENLSALANAATEAQNAVANTDSDNSGGLVPGIYENLSGEIRVVEMSDDDLKVSLEFSVNKMHQDNTDEYSINYYYTSDADFEDIVVHFDDLLLNTSDYMKMIPGEKTAMIQGHINDLPVYVTIDASQGGMPTVEIFIEL